MDYVIVKHIDPLFENCCTNRTSYINIVFLCYLLVEKDWTIERALSLCLCLCASVVVLSFPIC